jgi:hypothetical protein
MWFVYLWWMNLEEVQGVKLAPFGCHFFYFRREETRWRHHAGYFDTFGDVLHRHVQDITHRGKQSDRLDEEHPAVTGWLDTYGLQRHEARGGRQYHRGL